MADAHHNLEQNKASATVSDGSAGQSQQLAHPYSPSHIVSGSTRTRVVGVGLVAGLALTSGMVWASPGLRKNIDDALDKAPLPGVVQRALSEPSKHKASVTAKHDGKGGQHEQAKTEQRIRQLQLAAAQEKAKQAKANQGSTTKGANWSTGGNSKYPTSEFAQPGTGGPGSGNGGSSKKAKFCWDFQWQQDAQAVYAADPSDPNGLDGNPGPRDDDGIACRNLPDDPQRPASVPTWPYELPTPAAPPRAQIINPSKNYFGLFTSEAPFSFKELDDVAQTVQHRPSSVTWFAGWDQQFRADVVQASWRRDMLPIITWEPRPINTVMGPGTNNAVNPDYQLVDILNGDYDAYIRQWARDLRDVGLPVGVRFAHEMNGFWYPWSEQANGNTKGQFVQAWRHIHDLFEQEGARNAIWLWTPNVTGFSQSQPLDQLYPGSDYVDWVGLSGYYRKVIPGKQASFANTYGKTLADLRAVAPGKKILLAEVGATETGGQKQNWVSSFFDELPKNPDVIGFTWFNRQVTAVPEGEKTPVTNDWRITSSPETAALFRERLAGPTFSEGSAGPGQRWEWRKEIAPDQPAGDDAARTPSPSPSPTGSGTPRATPSPTGPSSSPSSPASPQPSAEPSKDTTPSREPSKSPSPDPSDDPSPEPSTGPSEPADPQVTPSQRSSAPTGAPTDAPIPSAG